MISSPIDLTAIVLTHNESLHIKRCLESLQLVAKHIVVVDSYSTDDTLDIAKASGARVYQNEWVNYATQFQWAIDSTEIDTEWIMRIDADEYVEVESINEFNKIRLMNREVNGIVIKRKYFFMGEWMRFGAMHPIYHLKIWRRGFGSIESKWMDERMVLSSGSAVQLNIAIVDDNKNNFTWWINKHNGYATREMVDLLNRKYQFLNQESQNYISGSFQSSAKRFIKDNIYTRLPIFIRPMLYFVYRYFIRLGFLDGKSGLIFHFMHACWYRCLVDAKVYEVEKVIAEERDPEKIIELIRAYSGLNL